MIWLKRISLHALGCIAIIFAMLVLTAMIGETTGLRVQPMLKTLLRVNLPMPLAAVLAAWPLLPGLLLGAQMYRKIAGYCWPEEANWQDALLGWLPIYVPVAMIFAALELDWIDTLEALASLPVIVVGIGAVSWIWMHRRADRRGQLFDIDVF